MVLSLNGVEHEHAGSEPDHTKASLVLGTADT